MVGMGLISRIISFLDNRMGYIMYLGAYNWGFLKWYFTVGE